MGKSISFWKPVAASHEELSEDNVIRWQQQNSNSNCQIECLKVRLKFFSIDNNNNDANAGTITIVLRPFMFKRIKKGEVVHV